MEVLIDGVAWMESANQRSTPMSSWPTDGGSPTTGVTRRGSSPALLGIPVGIGALTVQCTDANGFTHERAVPYTVTDSGESYTAP